MKLEQPYSTLKIFLKPDVAGIRSEQTENGNLQPASRLSSVSVSSFKASIGRQRTGRSDSGPHSYLGNGLKLHNGLAFVRRVAVL